MTKTIERIGISDVEKIVRESLALETDIELNANTMLKDLGAEPIDVLDIYFRLGMKLTDYVSGERISEKGRERMWNIAEANLYYYSYGTYKDVIHFIKLGMSKTSNEFINQLTLGDLVDIKNYTIEEERIKYDIEYDIELVKLV